MSRAVVSQVRAVIVDDHPLYREGLRFALMSAGIDVVGEAANGREAVAVVAAERPDVVLMDLHMPEMTGVDATREISAANPDVGVLVVTMFEDDESVLAAIRSGARGYLLKDASSVEVVRAVLAAAAGESVFGSAVARRLLAHLSGSGPALSPRPFPQLSDREQEVLDLMARGEGNARIASQLFLSPKTVRNHVSNVFMKLQVSGRNEAIVRAREAGLGRRPAAP